jgi:hypothetical protein
MDKEILRELEAKMLEIAKRVGDENAGFCGDASSYESNGDFVLWEGAGRVMPDLTCHWYGSPTEKTYVRKCASLSEVLEWIDEMDKLTR